MQPFLTIYTPTYKRPAFLKLNTDSVNAQTAIDGIEHVIVEDTIGRGVGGMYIDIHNHANDTHGDYVLVLSDDNVLADNKSVEDLYEFVARHKLADVIIWRGQLVNRVIPPDSHWGYRPRICQIDLSNFIVRGPLWRVASQTWIDAYAADFHFVDNLYQAGCKFSWFDRVGYRALAVMNGTTQEEWELAGNQLH